MHVKALPKLMLYEKYGTHRGIQHLTLPYATVYLLLASLFHAMPYVTWFAKTKHNGALLKFSVYNIITKHTSHKTYGDLTKAITRPW